MDSNKTKHITKNHNGQQRQKKPYRPTFNNDNPHNKLALNQFHQIQDEYNQKDNKKSDANKLHKRKRDLQRMIKHCQQKGMDIDETKKAQLQNIETQLNSRRKKYQKQKRKQFFLQNKYKNIKHIESRKIYRHLDDIKQNKSLSPQQKRQQQQKWQMKLRYIKHFPKTLKYISLFPTNKPLEDKTLEFQKKIMQDIEQQNKKRVSRLNYYKSENQAKLQKTSSKLNQQQQANVASGKNKNFKTEQKSKKQSILPMTKKQVISKSGKKMKKVVDDFFITQENSQQQNDEQQQVNQQQQSEQMEVQQDEQQEDSQE